MTHPAATLSTHVLDAGTGLPAVGVPLALLRRTGEGRTGDAWAAVGDGATDEDGRCHTLAPDGLRLGVWKLVFDTGAYFAATGQNAFYPEVGVVFEVTDLERHHHIPLLLSPFAYSTYRGS